MSKKYLYKILTPEQLDDATIYSDKFKRINTECAPELEPFYNSKHKKWEWILLKNWVVEYDGVVYTVPAGFVTDGATIPRWLWPMFGTPTDIPRLYVALLHDYLYTIGPTMDPNPRGPMRKQADQIYRDFNIQLGEPKVRTNVEYRFIRWFGGKHWVVEDEREHN